VQRRKLAIGGNGAIGGVCRGERLLVKADHDRVERRVDRVETPQVRLDHLVDRHLPVADEGSQLGRAHPPQFGAHSHGTLT
jgi:hypothetical protein